MISAQKKRVAAGKKTSEEALRVEAEMEGVSAKLAGLQAIVFPLGQTTMESRGRKNHTRADMLVNIHKALLVLEDMMMRIAPDELKDTPEDHRLDMSNSGSSSGKQIVRSEAIPRLGKQVLSPTMDALNIISACYPNLVQKGIIKPKALPEGPGAYMEGLTFLNNLKSRLEEKFNRTSKLDRLESDGADGGGHEKKDEIGRGKSDGDAMVEAAKLVLGPAVPSGKSIVKAAKLILGPAFPSPVIVVCAGKSMVESDKPMVKPAPPSPAMVVCGGESMVESDKPIVEPAPPSPAIVVCGGESMVESDKLIVEPAPPSPAIVVCGGQSMVESDKPMVEPAPPSPAIVVCGGQSMVGSDKSILGPAPPSPAIVVCGGESVVESGKPILGRAGPCPDIFDCGGDDKKDEMDMAKWFDEFESETEAESESVMGSDTNEGMSIVKSDKLILDPADLIPTRLEQYSVQDPDHDEMDRGKPGTLLSMEAKAAEEMAHEADRFALEIRYWESAWSKTFNFFTDTTALSSMQFTHYTPGNVSYYRVGSTPETLQIFSIKLAKIGGGLVWPLSVYGVVAARDIVDHNRNILFSCSRSQAQELRQDDPFLHLIGPSRAIVFTDMVDFEIQLKVKGTTKSEDKALISYVCNYNGGCSSGVSTLCIEKFFCTLELCLQRVRRTVQAIILGVQVVKYGSWPFEYGGRVTCSPPSEGEMVCTDSGVTPIINLASSQIVLLESKDKALPKGFDGYIVLSRQVVSVEAEGVLDLALEAYSRSSDTTTAQGHVRFLPKYCGISQDKCALDDAEVVITVAWSLVATSKREVVLERGLSES